MSTRKHSLCHLLISIRIDELTEARKQQTELDARVDTVDTKDTKTAHANLGNSVGHVTMLHGDISSLDCSANVSKQIGFSMLAEASVRVTCFGCARTCSQTTCPSGSSTFRIRVRARY